MRRETRAGTAVACAWVFGGALVGLALGAGVEDGAWGRIEGKVEPSPVGPVEVRFLSEAQLSPLLEEKLTRVREELERAEGTRDELLERMERAQAASVAADEALTRARAEILQRRLEVVRSAATVGQMKAQQRALSARSAKARQHASELKKAADAATREWQLADEAVTRLADGSALFKELPQPVTTTTAEVEGRFDTRLWPGKYAVAATTRAADGTTRVWLFWTQVEAGALRTLELTDENVARSKCESCLVSPRGPVVNR